MRQIACPPVAQTGPDRSPLHDGQASPQYIGQTKKSFEYLISKNLFPVIRRDRLVLIDKEDLDKFMANHKC